MTGDSSALVLGPELPKLTSAPRRAAQSWPSRDTTRSQNCFSNDARAEPMIPVHPARRLNPLAPAPHQQRLAQLLVAQLHRAHSLLALIARHADTKLNSAP